MTTEEERVRKIDFWFCFTVCSTGVGGLIIALAGMFTDGKIFMVLLFLGILLVLAGISGLIKFVSCEK